MTCCDHENLDHHEMTDTSLPVSLEESVPNTEITLYDPKTDTIISTMINDIKSQWKIFFFYPADFTFVCPTELKEVSALAEDFAAVWASVYVVSTDTVFTHKKRIETEPLLKDFRLPMIADRTGQLSSLFGVYNTTTGNAERWSFILDNENIIKSVEIVTEPIGRSSLELLRKVQALDHVRKNPGAACPASRSKWAKTIKPWLDIVGNAGKDLA